MFGGIDEVWIIYGAAALAAIMVAEGIYLLFAGRSDRRKSINRRMKLQDGRISQEQVLIQLRKERGLDGASRFSLDALRQLRTQSGLVMPLPRFLTITTGIAAAASLAAIVKGVPFLYGLLLIPPLAAWIPVVALKHLRKRRLKLFGIQLPEALELITRSLKAGHPVPVAISMVAREMPDPVGSEFGIVSDEVTYGADLETAMRNLYFRVGQDDLPLFVTAVAIQGSTGGNLSEILQNLSAIIRLRFKMRRKVKALAAEGKYSAFILSGLPVAMFAILQSMTPDFYGKVWHIDLTKIVLGCAAAWMLTGNYIMWRLVNFRI